MIELRKNNQQLRASLQAQRGASPSPGEITGYSSVYNSLSENLGGFKERVAPSAFRNSLRNNHDVRGLINHDPSLVIGRVSNGTLRLSSDDTGLLMQCTLPDTSYGRNLYASVLRGDISNQSFAFIVDPDGDSWDEEIDDETNSRIPVRTLRSVRLLDCSAVTNPAYSSSSVSAVQQLNSQPLADSWEGPRSLPSTCPAEFRSRIIESQQFSSKAKEARQRLFSLLS
jgi:HK97 family phage prohead protease